MAQAALSNVKTLLGPMAVGSVLSGVAFGCAVVQTYSYCQRFPKDSLYIKALVIFEMTLQTIHLVLMLTGLWHMVVTVYGHAYALLLFPGTVNVTLILCAPIAFAPQAFFIYRLWKLCQNMALAGFCSLLAVSRFAFHMAVGIAAYRIRDIALVVRQWKWCITTMFILSIACDAIVAVAVTHILRSQKTEFKRTSRIIDRLILYSVGTGLLTIGGELAQALCFWAMPHNCAPMFSASYSLSALLIYWNFADVWLGFYAVESGLYTNSLLATYTKQFSTSPCGPHPFS
ncbi:hypothetical protein EDC04DRAFT_2742528 [Pisolithus marmoratus]|nr:hypothetical protein EDC04DRAFT_2742528 [Pisolithus marmoratus]